VFAVFNIFVAVMYRLTGSTLPRESDQLVVLWRFRWLPPFNTLIFILGVIFGEWPSCVAARGERWLPPPPPSGGATTTDRHAQSSVPSLARSTTRADSRPRRG